VCQCLDVFAITIAIAFEFRKHEIVPFERPYLKVPELVCKHSREAAFVLLRHGSDAHHVNVNPVSLVQRTAFAGKAGYGPEIGSLA
jgi:hypothetical protein